MIFICLTNVLFPLSPAPKDYFEKQFSYLEQEAMHPYEQVQFVKEMNECLKNYKVHKICASVNRG